MYKDFARLYDDLMDDFDYEEWFLYIEKIFEKYKVNPRTLLEMACGTGNLSFHLGKKGYKLTCFDLSDEMLAIANKKLRGFKNVKILRQNMVDFDLKKRYDCILSVCDSINYILEDSSLFSVFQNAYNHLEDGGIFIFDINSKYKLQNIIGNNIFLEDRDNIFYTWENIYDINTDICEFFLTFFYEEDKGLFRRADEYHRERAYSIDEITKALKSVGFSNIDIYDAFNLNKPNEKSERINFVVGKQ